MDESISMRCQSRCGSWEAWFLATLSPRDLENELPPLLKGDFLVKRRSLIGFRDRTGKEKIALNDLVVKRGRLGGWAIFQFFAEKKE